MCCLLACQCCRAMHTTHSCDRSSTTAGGTSHAMTEHFFTNSSLSVAICASARTPGAPLTTRCSHNSLPPCRTQQRCVLLQRGCQCKESDAALQLLRTVLRRTALGVAHVLVWHYYAGIPKSTAMLCRRSCAMSRGVARLGKWLPSLGAVPCALSSAALSCSHAQNRIEDSCSPSSATAATHAPSQELSLRTLSRGAVAGHCMASWHRHSASVHADRAIRLPATWHATTAWCGHPSSADSPEASRSPRHGSQLPARIGLWTSLRPLLLAAAFPILPGQPERSPARPTTEQARALPASAGVGTVPCSQVADRGTAAGAPSMRGMHTLARGTRGGHRGLGGGAPRMACLVATCSAIRHAATHKPPGGSGGGGSSGAGSSGPHYPLGSSGGTVPPPAQWAVNNHVVSPRVVVLQRGKPPLEMDGASAREAAIAVDTDLVQLPLRCEPPVAVLLSHARLCERPAYALERLKLRCVCGLGCTFLSVLNPQNFWVYVSKWLESTKLLGVRSSFA